MADPLRELLAFQEKVNRLFDNALTRSELGRDPTAVGQWAPPTSVVETADTLILEAELQYLCPTSTNLLGQINIRQLGPTERVGNRIQRTRKRERRAFSHEQ